MVTKLIAKLNYLRYRRLSLRGMAIILNTVALSKIWFIASLLQLPKWALKQIEKHIYAFVWENKGMEPIQRKTLYLPTDQGGLGILHPLLQCQALTIKYFLFITDQNKQITWLQFARYWMSLRLAKYDPNWSFLKSNSTPKYNGTDPPIHYQEMEQSFTRHKSQLLKQTNKTGFYSIVSLRTEYHKQHNITSQSKWDTTFNSKLPWKKLWTHTYQSHARGKTDDTIFRILHNSYPKGAKMKYNRQKGNLGPNCKYCITQGKTKLETTSHVFAACSFATKIWQQYKIIYTTLQPNTPFRYENIVLTINLTLHPTPKPTCKLLLTVTSFILTELWQRETNSDLTDSYRTTNEA